MAIDHMEKVRLLAVLCSELARLGVHAMLSDARPALWLPDGPAGPRRWISVSLCGEFYEWRRGTGTSLVTADPRGAARRIARELHSRAGGPDDPPTPSDPPANRFGRCRK